MARRRKKKRGIALPWEQRGTWLRGMLSGQRWKVVLLVVLLVGAGVLIWREARHHAKVRSTRVAISRVQRAITSFRIQMGRCPQSTVELVHPPEPVTRQLDRMPVDGWGNALWLECPARLDAEGADVISAGPSGSFFVDDNIQ